MLLFLIHIQLLLHGHARFLNVKGTHGDRNSNKPGGPSQLENHQNASNFSHIYKNVHRALWTFRFHIVAKYSKGESSTSKGNNENASKKVSGKKSRHCHFDFSSIPLLGKCKKCSGEIRYRNLVVLNLPATHIRQLDLPVQRIKSLIF